MNKLIRRVLLLFFISLTVCLSGCSYYASMFDNTELHVIGVYEGDYKEDKRTRPCSSTIGTTRMDCRYDTTDTKNTSHGEVIVNVLMTDAPIILALTAHDKTKWIINNKEGVKIKKVILGGYYAQSIEGIDGNVPVEIYTYDNSPCDTCIKGDGFFYSYQSAPAQLKKITGIQPSSFQGKYSGGEFDVFINKKITNGLSEKKNQQTQNGINKNFAVNLERFISGHGYFDKPVKSKRGDGQPIEIGYFDLIAHYLMQDRPCCEKWGRERYFEETILLFRDLAESEAGKNQYVHKRLIADTKSIEPVFYYDFWILEQNAHLSKIHYKNGDKDLALKELQKILDYDKSKIQMMSMYTGKEKTQSAISIGLADLAEFFISNHEYEVAEKIINNFYVKNEQIRAKYYYLLISDIAENKDIGKNKDRIEAALTAIKTYEDAAVHAKSKISAFSMLSDSYLKLGDFDKSRVYMEKAKNIFNEAFADFQLERRCRRVQCNQDSQAKVRGSSAAIGLFMDVASKQNQHEFLFKSLSMNQLSDHYLKERLLETARKNNDIEMYEFLLNFPKPLEGYEATYLGRIYSIESTKIKIIKNIPYDFIDYEKFTWGCLDDSRRECRKGAIEVDSLISLLSYAYETKDKELIKKVEDLAKEKILITEEMTGWFAVDTMQMFLDRMSEIKNIEFKEYILDKAIEAYRQRRKDRMKWDAGWANTKKALGPHLHIYSDAGKYGKYHKTLLYLLELEGPYFSVLTKSRIKI